MQPPVSALSPLPRYRTLAALGSGGMASVHLAVSAASQPEGRGRIVAVKQLHAHLADNVKATAMMLDEARIASQIEHPNVVRVVDVEMFGEDLALVMEYVEGESLWRLLRSARKTGEPIPVPIVARVVHDALLGLHAAHELRDELGRSLELVHRDVTPHNLLVGADGVTRVTDFGVALAAGRLAFTATEGVVKGKLGYLAPEQVYRSPIDRRVDVFAAGIVLWEALTGTRLFSGATEGETLAMILRESIAPPSVHRPDISIELDEVCLRALERNRERRYASALDLASAIAGSTSLASHELVGAFVRRHAAGELARRADLVANALAATATVDGPRVEPTRAAAPTLRTLAYVGSLVAAVALGAGATAWLGRGPSQAITPAAARAEDDARSASSGTDGATAATLEPSALAATPSAADLIELTDDPPASSSAATARPHAPQTGKRPHPARSAPPRPASKSDAGTSRYVPKDL